LGAFSACNGWLRKIGPFASSFYAAVAFLVSVLLFSCNVPLVIAPVKAAIIAVAMIFSLSVLCVRISQKVEVNKDAIYAQTFTIFLLSWPCQAVANVITERLLQWPYYAIMPIQFCTGIIGPMMLICLIAKIEKKYNFHWISFILGK